ncbi:MAG: hypothetical protein GX559_02125 [Candidatus Pacebacteria bacterium]|nr:hypothetical protein [Candidatus Paceibacterota bacterium]
MSKERRGIPGITHPPDETDRPQTNYSRPEPKDHGLGQLLQAPKDIIVTGLRAIAGALTISLARTLGIRDSVSRAEKDLAIYESQLNKRKGNTEKLQEKIDKTKALLTELNKGVELSEAILNIQEDYNELLADDEHLLSLLAKTIGKEGLETIKGSFLTNQKTQVGVKSVTDEEIKLAQEFFARADNDEERSSSLKQHIQQLAETNLIVLGKQLVNLAKIKEIDEINQETNFPINWVSWDEALAASVMGATGRTQESLRGGYGVNMKAGGLNVSAGQDISQIGPMEQIVVHADIPQNIEAARSVANGEVPLFRSAIIKSLFRKAMGDLSLLPGRIDINNTGNNNTKSYPALDVNRQMNNITLVRKAAIEMQKILKGLEQIDLGKDDDQATQKSKLITVGSRGALAIPRYQVIVDLMEQISATDPGIIANLSEQYRVLEEVADEDLNDQNLDGEADLAEEQQEEQEDQADEDEDQNINQKERDLIEAVFPQGIDQRNARRIINRPKIYFDNFTKRFGLITGIRTMVAVAKEARRLVDTQKTDQNEGDLVEAVFPRGIDQRTARQIIKHPKIYFDNFTKRFGLITGIRTMVAVAKEARRLVDQEDRRILEEEALKLAGYFHGMSIEQATNFIDNLQANREKLRRMYGTKKGNKTADLIKEFAKKILGQVGNFK